MPRDLLVTVHSRVVIDDDAQLLIRERTDERFATLEDVEREYETIARTIESLPRDAYAMLVDLRLAPPRNDDAYEAIAQRYNARLYTGFRRVAVLVLTAAGKLQLRRFLDRARADARVFNDEGEAHAYLTSGE